MSAGGWQWQLPRTSGKTGSVRSRRLVMEVVARKRDRGATTEFVREALSDPDARVAERAAYLVPVLPVAEAQSLVNALVKRLTQPPDRSRKAITLALRRFAPKRLSEQIASDLRSADANRRIAALGQLDALVAMSDAGALVHDLLADRDILLGGHVEGPERPEADRRYL